jgi:Thioredoxin
MKWTLLLLAVGGVVWAQTPAEAIKGEEPVVELVVYSDFQCPFCGQFSKPMEEFRDKGVDGIKTKVVFKNFPLSFHPDAQLAAQAAQAAAAQGKFWEMHDLMFANQSSIKREHLIGYWPGPNSTCSNCETSLRRSVGGSVSRFFCLHKTAGRLLAPGTSRSDQSGWPLSNVTRKFR